MQVFFAIGHAASSGPWFAAPEDSHAVPQVAAGSGTIPALPAGLPLKQE
jgi:hypothetical protein